MGNSALSPRPAKIHIGDDKDPSAHSLKTTPTKANDPKKLIEAAVKRKNWNEVIDLLVKHSLSIHSMSKENPLDLAITWNCPLEVIKTVVSLDPIKAFTITNAKKQTALHLALESEHDFEVIDYLLQEAPSADELLIQPDSESNIPLHIALSKKTHFGIIQYLIEKSPNTIRNRTKNGGYPLHVALEHRLPENIVLFLMDTYPAAIQYSVLGYYPIHIACKQAYSIQLIEKILSNFSDAAMLCGPDSNLPLHYAAMSNKSSLEVIQTLIKLYPEGMMHRSKKGNMPLHLALEHRWDDSKLRTLINSCPEAVSQRGRGTPGDFPLSIAIESRASNHILQELLRIFPQACSYQNVYRMYLLRSAVKAKVSWHIIEQILDAYPAAAGEKDSTSQRLALHYAVSRSYPLSLVYKLIAAYPPGVGTGDVHGLLPLHIAATRAGYLTLTRDPMRTNLEPNEAGSESKSSTNHQEVAGHDISSDITKSSIEARLDYDLKLFRMLVTRFPESVTALDKYGLSPINYLIENTQVLHQDQSNSGKIISHVGLALLKCLCDHDAWRHVSPEKRKIVRIGNESVQMDSNSFKSAFVAPPVTQKINPLHHAIHCNRDVDYIHTILQYDSSLAAATAIDPDTGRTTLHAAIERKIATACLLVIIDAAPDAVKIRDKSSFLPLHCAIVCGSERIVIQRLLMLFPDITKVVDDPVHVAAASKGLSLGDSLVADANTHAGKIIAEGGHFMLFHFALHHRLDAASLADVLSYTMPYMPPTATQLATRAADGRDTTDDHFRYQEAHFHLWYDLICHSYDLYPETINVLFDDYEYTSRVIQLLCDFPNCHLPSRVTLAMATPRCHEQLVSRLYFHERYAWMPPRRDDHVELIEEDQQTSVTLSNQKEMLSFHHRSQYAVNKVAFDHRLSSSSSASVSHAEDATVSSASVKNVNTLGSFGYRHNQPRKVMLKFTQQRHSFETEMVFRKNVIVQITRRVEEEYAQIMDTQRKQEKKKQHRTTDATSTDKRKKNDAVSSVNSVDDEKEDDEDDDDEEDDEDDDETGNDDRTTANDDSVTDKQIMSEEEKRNQQDVDTVTQYTKIQASLEEEQAKKARLWKEQRVNTLMRRFFLEMIASYNADTDTEYRAELTRQRFVANYPYLLATAYAPRTLHDLLIHDHPLVSLQQSWRNANDHARIPSALNWSELGIFHTRIQDILLDMCQAVQFLHTLGYVHTNINPMNVYEIRDFQKKSGFRLVLGNFGCMKKAKESDPSQQQTAQAVHVSQEIANLHSLSDVLEMSAGDFMDNRAYGYMAPELARCYLMLLATQDAMGVTAADDAAAWQTRQVGSHSHPSSSSSRPRTHDRPENATQRAQPNIALSATPALDLWSLGAIAYHLGAGEPLLNPSFDQRVDVDQLQLLSAWETSNQTTVKERRLLRLAHHPWLRNLVQQWLSAEDQFRPTIAEVLQRHPFFTELEAQQTPPLVTNITGLNVKDPVQTETNDGNDMDKTHPQPNKVRFLPQAPLYDFYIAFNHSHFLYDRQQREGRSKRVLTVLEKDSSMRSNDQEHFHRLQEALKQYCRDVSLTGSQEFASFLPHTNSNDIKFTIKQPIPAQVLLDFHHRHKLPPLYESLPPLEKEPLPISKAPPVASSTKKIPAKSTGTTSMPKTTQEVHDCLVHIFKQQSQSKTGVMLFTRHGLNHPAELDERNDPSSLSTLNLCRLVKSSPLYLYLFELVLMLELHARGWFENGLYIIVAGDNVSKSDPLQTAATTHNTNVVFGSFFEHFKPPQDTKDPIFVPANAENPLDNVTMIRQVGNCFPLPTMLPSHQIQSIRLAVQTILDIHGLGKTLRYPELTIKELFLQVLLPLPTVSFPVLHLLGPISSAYNKLALDLLRLTHPTLPSLYRHLDSRGRLSISRSSRGGAGGGSRAVSTAGSNLKTPKSSNRSSSNNSAMLLVPNIPGNMQSLVDVAATGLTPAFQRMLDMRVPSPGIHLQHPEVSNNTEYWFTDREPVMPRSAIGSRASSRQGVKPTTNMTRRNKTPLADKEESHSPTRPIEEENLRAVSPQHYKTVTDIIAPTGTTTTTHMGGTRIPSPSFRDVAHNAEVLILDSTAVSSGNNDGLKMAATTNTTTSVAGAVVATDAYFTELTAQQQQQKVDMLRFCVEKHDSKANEINNMKMEMSLMQEQIRLQQLEILRLRGLVQVTSIRELPPTYIDDDDVDEEGEENEEEEEPPTSNDMQGNDYETSAFEDSHDFSSFNT